tara:strand:+ start:1488 stop:2177 length:690 start_codon:yes stop_codon:yes gene_type:complete
MTSMNTNIWFNDPTVLLNKHQMNQLWPTENMSRNEKINAITRLIIILSILGYLLTNAINFFLTGFVTLGVIVFLYYAKESQPTTEPKEAFTNPSVYKALKSNFTNPTEKNPLMNVLLPEISENPNRKRAAPAYNRAVEKSINEKTEDFIVSNFDDDPKIKKRLFSNLGDSFEFEEFGQYQFFAKPNTTVPNDQHAFAEFCYGDMPSAKEGNEFALAKNLPRIGGIGGQN